MIKFCTTVFAFLLFVLVFSCQNKQPATSNAKAPAMLEPVSAEETGITHSNILTETEEWNYLHYFYFYNGAGVATGDINNDGLVDIYLSANQKPGTLYLNKGDFKFENITASAGIDTKLGWKTGTLMADINGDGLLDIYVCRAGIGPAEERANLLFINNGDLTFTERAAELGLADSNQSIGAYVLDKDLDGDLDVFVVNHSSDFHLISALFWQADPESPRHGENHLYEQQDDGTFVDVSVAAGIIQEPDFSLSATILDVNQDGYPDIYVANDYWFDDHFYINNGDGTFSNQNQAMLPRNTMFSMGSDAADLNNDGWPDLMSVDMMPEDIRRQKSRYNQFSIEMYDALEGQGNNKQYSRNMLFFNDEGNGFVETAQLSGIAETDWSWAILGVDLDNDGWKDILVTNGIKRDVHDLDYTQKKFGEMDPAGISYLIENKLSMIEEIPTEWTPNYVYRNRGDMTFENVTGEWGFDIPLSSQGLATADLDNDGDLDIIINNTDTTVTIYRNRSNTMNNNHYLKVALKGVGKNPFGIGTKVLLYANGSVQLEEIQASRGYQSSPQNLAFFGLGSQPKVDSLVVYWPDSRKETFTSVKLDTLLTVNHENSIDGGMERRVTKPKYFTKASLSLPVLKHEESKFNDFDVDRLIPHKLSLEGPAIATADVNGDGNDDIFISGGRKKPNTLWLSTPRGYVKAASQPWNDDLGYEVINAVYFDANNDGLLDLYLASGSNEFNIDDVYQQDRLFLNTGNGVYKAAEGALPQMYTSTKAVVPIDFDNDGDMDLFVGGLLLPRKYGLPPQSYLLINDGGKFRDATDELAPELKNVGMVTTALWADVDGDKQADLVLAGEYLGVTIFINKDGKLHKQKNNGLEHTQGWWRSLAAADFDGDGDIDLVGGNYGENVIFDCTVEAPGILYVNDFDKNGSLDPVFTCEANGFRSPFVGRDLFCEQMPFYNNKFLTYTKYATTAIDSFFTPELYESAHQAKVSDLRNGYFENTGAGNFVFKPFPPVVQLAPVYDIEVMDINGDGNLDILMAGNSNGDYFLYGDADASKGITLLGDGKGNFTYLSHNSSGFIADKYARNITTLTSNGKNYLLVGNNGDTAQVYQLVIPAVN